MSEEKGGGNGGKTPSGRRRQTPPFIITEEEKKIIKTQGAGVWIGGPITWKEVRKRVLLGEKKMNSKKGDPCDEDAAPCIC